MHSLPASALTASTEILRPAKGAGLRMTSLDTGLVNGLVDKSGWQVWSTGLVDRSGWQVWL